MPTILRFMADNYDPASQSWKFSGPTAAEDTAIAREMLSLMKTISVIREKYPTSCVGLELSVYGGLLRDGGRAIQDFLGATGFQSAVIQAFIQVGLIDPADFAARSDVATEVTQVGVDIAAETAEAAPDLRSIVPRGARVSVADAKLVKQLGQRVQIVMGGCEFAVIMLSHYAVFVEVEALKPNAQYPPITRKLFDYEIADGMSDRLAISVEHTRLRYDLLALFWSTAGSLASGLAGAKVGAIIGSLAPGIGTAVGGAIGGIIGSVAGGYLAEQAVDLEYDSLTQTGWLPLETHEKFRRLVLEKNTHVEIVDIWSTGNDNYVPFGELVHVLVRNTGSIDANVRVQPFASDWTIFAADWLDVALLIASPTTELARLVTGQLRPNYREITVPVGGEVETWFLISPFGRVADFPYVAQFSSDNVGFAAYYQHSEFSLPIFLSEKHESFGAFGPGPAFGIDAKADELVHSPGDIATVEATVQNIGTEGASCTLGVSFRSAITSVEYSTGVAVSPSQATLAPGATKTFAVQWVIPTGTWGQFQIAVNCWQDATFTALYPDDLMWQDIFYVATPIMGASLSLTLFSPADMHLNDPAGRTDGEIPGAVYDPQSISVQDPLPGTYAVRLVGTGTGLYQVQIDANYFASFASETVSGTIVVGQILEFTATLGVQSGLITLDVSDPAPFSQNQAPVASIGGPMTGFEGQSVLLDGSGSSDLDGTIVSWEWDCNGDGLIDATGPIAFCTWFDNTVATVTLKITSVNFITIGSGPKATTVAVYQTSYASRQVTIYNRDPATQITRGYLFANLRLRLAGEKWHDARAEILEFDSSVLGKPLSSKDGGTSVASVRVYRTPGSPDNQSRMVPEVFIDIEKVYVLWVEYNPADDPVNGQLNGASPAWVSLEFKDGTETLHHTFNVQQSIIRDTDRWIHVEPWVVDLSRYFVNHEWTFDQRTTDPGTDDLCLRWDWGDGTQTAKNYAWDGSWSVPQSTCFDDRGSTPYDLSLGSYPPTTTESFFHIYLVEGTYVVSLHVADDDLGIARDTLAVAAIHLPHIAPTR